MTASVIFLLFASLVIPLLCVLLLVVLKAGTWKSCLYGALIQIAALMMIRIPLSALFVSQPWFASFIETSPIGYVFVYALFSSLVTFLLMWLVQRFVFSRFLDLYDGLGFGLGFSAMESALFSGISALNILLASESTLIGIGTAADVVWMGVQRLALLVLQTGISLLCAKAIIHKNKKDLALSFVLLLAVMLVGMLAVNALSIPSWVLNVLLALGAVGMGWWIFKTMDWPLRLPEKKADNKAGKQ